MQENIPKDIQNMHKTDCAHVQATVCLWSSYEGVKLTAKECVFVVFVFYKRCITTYWKNAIRWCHLLQILPDSIK